MRSVRDTVPHLCYQAGTLTITDPMTKDSDPRQQVPHRGRKFRGKRLKTALPRPAPVDVLPERKGTERIAKAMARAGVASRREAEAWIAAGRVAVNGAVISSPALNVTPADKIAIDGQPMPTRERTRLFLFHKPRGLVTTSADTHDRPTIFGALPKGLPRLISVGRLDLNTEGLILLTNDGGLARALELPATGWLRRYRVRAHGKVTQAQLDGLRNGIEVDGVQYGAIEATLEREQGANVWLSFAMREGKNREIRNVMRALGLQVNRLIRVSYGPFQLAELPDGAIEEVKTRVLREQLGERIAALSGADFSGPVTEREIAESHAQPSRRHSEVRDAQRRPSKVGGAARGGERTGKRNEKAAPQRDAKLHRHKTDRKPRRNDRGDAVAPPREEKKIPPRSRRQPHRGRHGSGPRPSRPKVH